MSNSDSHLSSHSMSPQDQIHSYCAAALHRHLSSAAPRRTLEDNTCYLPLLPVCKEEVIDLPLLPVCKEEVATEQQERNPSLVQEEAEPPQIKEEQQEWSTVSVQEEPEPPQIKQEEELLQTPEEPSGSTLTLLVVKCEDDDENVKTEPLASTSTEHRKTQAEECATSWSSSDERVLSSHGSESDTEDSDEWEETREDQSALNTLQSHKIQQVEGHRSSLSSKLPQDLKSSKPTPTTRSHTEKNSCVCTECGKVFFPMSRLKQHMRIHTGDSPFTCTVCQRRFNKNSDLKRHALTHTGEKPFTCTDCQRSFSQNGHLKRHMLTHTVEKAFTCNECGAVFVHMGNLKVHMRVHTGEKHFACTDCGKVFGYLSKMKQHMLTHTGEKPFSCTCCSKVFGHMASLKLHMRIHTGEVPFTCKVCEIRFTTNGDLDRHMRIHTAVCLLGGEETRDVSYKTHLL